MNKQLLRGSLTLLTALSSVGIHAQVTTSGVVGTITDHKTGETLIGASVLIRHEPTGTVYGGTTNTKGNFAVRGLRPGGPYTIEISYIGYQTSKLTGINLTLGENETLNVKLKDDAKVLEQVVVTGKKGSSFNANRTGAGSSFSRANIENVPSVSRSLFDIAKLTPQASISSNGAVTFAGSNNRYNSFQIDGTVSNDVFGLSSSGTNGGQTGANPISLEAIDAIQVVIAPYDVRQSGFTGGGINVVTKSGTNRFSGSVYDYYKNQNFFGTTPGKNIDNRRKLDKQHDNTFGFTLGGPIVKDKLFFFINGETQDASTPSRYLVGEDSEITVSEAQQISNKIKALTGGYDGGGYGPQDVETKSKRILTRLDWNINSAHRLSLRYSYLDASRLNYSNGQRALRFNHNGYVMNSKTHSIVGELNSRLSNSLSNELRIGYNRIRDFREAPGQLLPQVQIKLDSRRSAYFGTDPYSAANRLNQDIFTFSDNLTYSTGNHTLTFGTHNEFFKIENLFIGNNAGSYVYSSLADFLSIGTAGEANPERYDYAFSRTDVTGTRSWAPSFRAAQIGFYAQDEWKVSDLLRLTYGLRVDIPLFLDTPRANEAFNASAIAQQHGVQNHTMPKSTPLFSPRIGFRYNLDETRRQLIRGGIGVFTGRIPFVWISNSFANTGVELSSTSLRNARDFTTARTDGFAFQIDPNRQYYNNKVPSAEVNMVTRNFKFPQTLRANLAFETVLPFGIKATLEGVWSKNLNNMITHNLNQAKTGSTLNHGGLERPLYQRVSRDYTYLILLDNTNKGYSYNFSASLSKEFKFGLSASLAYTYGKSMAPMDGTSSQARSNWRYNYTFDPMEEDMAYSSFDVRHRLVGNLSYRVEYGKHFATTIGIIYNGQSGRRFSMAYNGDINGDGEYGNDLLYIPTDNELAGMNFSSAANRQQFADFINSHEEIAAYKGKYLPRNGMVTPFVNQFDLHIAQDFFLKIGGRRHTLQLVGDIINVGNLLNRGWGLEYSAGYSQTPLKYANGVYTFTPYKGDIWTVSDLDSRWKAQIGVKYIF